MSCKTSPVAPLSLLTRSRVEDKSVRYVAEENIGMISQEVDQKLMALAGQHFKRWDEAAMSFVSNIQDEFPND